VKRDGVGMPSVFAATSSAVFGGFVIRVRVKPELNPVYACSFFLLPSTRRRVIDASNTATITNISQPSLLHIEIPLPPLSLQKAFAERVTELREIEAEQATCRTHFDALFHSLLHNAFNGAS
jgi:type I restriction enzyme, S subunit